MAGGRESEPVPTQRRRKPATTPDGREQQLIAMAVDLAEKRFREGTASAQEIVHYLKLGSSRERLEQERLRKENDLLGAKTEAIASASRMEDLIQNAIDAMRSYSGSPPEEQYSD